MTQSLPDKKRTQAMRQVQEAALNLFEKHGFDAVSMSTIAKEAQVPERSIYRYFGTKESILMWKEADLDFTAEVLHRLEKMTFKEALYDSVSQLDISFTETQRQHISRILALSKEIPSVQAQAAAQIMQIGTQVGAALANARGLEVGDLGCRIEATAATTALVFAAEQWEYSQSKVPLSQALTEAITALDQWGQ